VWLQARLARGGNAGLQRPLRIVVTVAWARLSGGAEAMLQALIEGGEANGYELQLVFLEPGPWPEQLRQAGLHVDVITAGRIRQPHRWLASVTQLAGILRRAQPDLIIDWAAKTHLYGAPAAVMSGMADRVLWWQHAIPHRNWIDQCATLLPAIAIGYTANAAAEAQRRMPPTRPMFVVHAGTSVPPTRIEPGPLELPRDVVVVGLVGRLQRWKGQDRLLRAQAILRERGHNMHVVIVGGDSFDLEPAYARSLPRIVGELGLTGAVTMTGEVPDAGPYIDQLDILVNASDPEPFGIVLLEGMARGVSVVAVNSGGPTEIVSDGETGVLARSGTPQDLADALQPLLASPTLRHELGEAGRERFMRDFTNDAMCKRFAHNVNRLISEKRSAVEHDPFARPANAVAPACAVTIIAHDIGPVGGMERVLAELILGLRALGHDVTVIARTCDLPAGAGVHFHRVRGPGRPFLLAYPWFLLAGSLALRRWGRGVIQATGGIVLGLVDIVAVHYCHQVGPANPSRSTLLFRWNIKLVRVVKRLAERLSFRANRSATFVCVSDGVADEVREHYPQLADRVMTIHNGIDTDAYAPGSREDEARAMREQLQIPQDRLVAVFVGSEWERKGLRPVLDALTLATEWSLVVVGRGDERRYRELAELLGVGGSVSWLGVRKDVGLIYALADAFVLPTSYETFSLVTFEAAASGLPVLATAVNGISELVQEGENGFLIEPQAHSIAQRLRQLAGDPELRARLGGAARRSALRFGRETMVAKHHELYQRLAAGRRPADQREPSKTRAL
jgi:glycosyltransferase involved in cell wall biosynthesis